MRFYQRKRMRRFSHILLLTLLTGLAGSTAIVGQVKPQTPQQPDDVLRVKTELVQTDLTVVDKHGHLIGGLTADDFELRVDSKLQPLSFFEEVAAGSAAEERQLSAARKGDTAALATLKERTDSATDRGRIIFFFVDDVHLTSESLTRAR